MKDTILANLRKQARTSRAPKGAAKTKRKNTKATARKVAPARRGKAPQPEKSQPPKFTIGIDLGDRNSSYCILGEEGEVVKQDKAPTTKSGFARVFGCRGRCRIALEVGTHSRWVCRLLRSFGHEVYVANARQLRLIAESKSKDDRTDALQLARLARADPKLLSPIEHRSPEAQADLALIHARAQLVNNRTRLINHLRGKVKSCGERLRPCDADQFGPALAGSVPAELQAAAEPMLTAIADTTKQIKEYDLRIEVAAQRYPPVKLLTAVAGVGTLTALTFLLTLADPQRFARSRDAGCYVGLRPGRRQSGRSNPELRITKEGDGYLRTLLVQAAHTILSRRAPDSDLQRWGRGLSGGNGKPVKKRAVIAVARKLAVLLHRLWVSGEGYDPLYQARRSAVAAAA